MTLFDRLYNYMVLMRVLEGVSNGRLINNYSGPGMFNETCWAIESDSRPMDVEARAFELGLKGGKIGCHNDKAVVYWPLVRN